MSQQDKETVRRIPEEITTLGKFELIDEIFAPDFVEHSFPPSMGLAPGREGIRQYISMVRAGLPDVDLKVHQIISEDDMVAVRNVGSGTHTGDSGAPAILPSPFDQGRADLLRGDRRTEDGSHPAIAGQGDHQRRGDRDARRTD